jgi:uncharacterized protein YndB with AHSA1/START domain
VSKLTLTAEPGSHELVITREFDVPRERVYAAYTDPEQVATWWGPEGVTTIVDQMDARKGGTWRYIHRGAEGEEYAFSGVYHEAVAPERLVYTFEFEGMPGHVLLETITFEELPSGRTRMIDHSVYQSVADRDGMLSYGMEDGANASMNRLEALLG